MRCRYITLEVTAAQRTLMVTFGDPFAYGASGSSVLLRGELAADETPCDGLEFTTDDFVTENLLRPCAVGTAVVEPADCDGPPPEECCVQGACCVPLCCVFKGDVVWAPVYDFDDLVFNEETGIWEPEGGWLPLPPQLGPDGGVPGYLLADNPLTLGYGYYREYCPDVECDPAAALADFTAAVQAVDPYAGTKWEAFVAPVNGQGSAVGSSYLNGTEEGIWCGGPISQAACEEVRGEFHAVYEDCVQFVNCGYFACCLPDGSCVSVHPHECEQMGGTRGTDRCENYDCGNPFP
jgi:hypothetical protein